MKNILVLGVNNNLGRQIVSNLSQNNYQIKILSDEYNKNNFNKISNISAIEIDLKLNIDAKAMSRVQQIIICLETDTEREHCYGNTAFTLEQLANLIAAINYLSNGKEKTLFNFTKITENNALMWNSVDDVVMGGVSQSNFSLGDGYAVFDGYVSTDNNGGFASVRTRNFASPLDLSAYKGIEIRLKGDGKRYKFIARCEGEWDGIGYCYSFDTVYDYPQTIKVPFEQLHPVFRAKTVTDAPPLDSSKVYSLQLMLSKFEYDGELNPKFEAGNFNLAIEYLKAYSSDSQPQLVIVNSGMDDALEKIALKTNCDCVIVRDREMSDTPADKVFNQTLVETAIAVQSSIATREIWLAIN